MAQVQHMNFNTVEVWPLTRGLDDTDGSQPYYWDIV